MTDTDWADERAGKLVGLLGGNVSVSDVIKLHKAIEAALREAEQRGKAAAEAHGLEARRRAHEHEQQAVAQAIERCAKIADWHERSEGSVDVRRCAMNIAVKIRHDAVEADHTRTEGK